MCLAICLQTFVVCVILAYFGDFLFILLFISGKLDPSYSLSTLNEPCVMDHSETRSGCYCCYLGYKV